MSVTTIEFDNFLLEVVEKLRNADIFTTTQRGVTTATATPTLSSDTTTLINVSNGRNIRSITIDGGDPLVYGQDFTVDYNYNDSGTTKIQITFTSAQTGAGSISYDYGTDKIFPDYPDSEMNISSYPRIACGLSPSPSIPGGLGNVNETSVFFEINVYDPDVLQCLTYQKNIRAYLLTAQSSFYYVKGPIVPVNFGQPVPSPTEQGKTKIHQHKSEWKSVFNYEVN